MNRPDETSPDQVNAQPIAKALPRTGEKCKKCPPELGSPKQFGWSMSVNSREYQGRVTGFPYSVEESWSMEWNWEGRAFDGFKPDECLLQEAKAQYDNFLNKDDEPYTKVFDKMQEQAADQADVVNANPPARLRWYFQQERSWKYMRTYLLRLKIESIQIP